MNKSKSISEWNNDNVLNAKKFSLKGYILEGRVIDIIDGDTIIVIIYILDNYYKFNIRLLNIDTYELNSKNPIKKQLAVDQHIKLLHFFTLQNTRINAQEYLIKNTIICSIHCDDFDNFGRLLATVYYNDIDISKIPFQ